MQHVMQTFPLHTSRYLCRQVQSTILILIRKQATSVHSVFAADGKTPLSLEAKTYEDTTEKLGQKSQQEQQPAGAQPAFA